ncbi:MAG: hypothetical protein M1833_001105 [Piccolia ochrophora]|nr:MAG: hypothetical protein M1833_001105 [Piccolia ochrophora]
MFGILQAPTPAKQTATDTIAVLSSRLVSATLLEDRRAAILGLRSFAKEYPASVASGALRGLIGSLSKDAADVDTIKVILETLLTLFSPNESSPEASDDIALWLADEFTQRQENISVLFDLLDTHDFYSRLYVLQLLSAILSARAERTKECTFSAPLGIGRLVAVLDDRREAVRNEGLLLLTSLTPSSGELQKLVAFENGFDRVFTLITSEGSLSHGGIVIQDCLSLLANLLRLNVSNQSFFRETGCVPKLAKLIGDAVRAQESGDGVAEWAKPQRDKNMWGVLAVLRLFLVHGGLGTQANQTSFWQSGVPMQVLHLAFSAATEMAVRAEALITCAELIRGNAKLQEAFAQLEVQSSTNEHASGAAGTTVANAVTTVNVIHGLLDLALIVTATQAFDVRLAACECIKAYFYRHNLIKMHFLRRAIEGHSSGADETPNIISTILRIPETTRSVDPYRSWFASMLLLHLVYEDPEAKALAMSVAFGDASKGEEVVTLIQGVTGSLIGGFQQREDERVSVGYLMLLCGWLFEDPDAVNDFLGEGSSVQSLVQAISQGESLGNIVQGLCAVLLGILYEFSTKDSPIPRATLHPILSSRLGREQYIDRITRLREHPLLRDYEVLPQGLEGDLMDGLPKVLFDKVFVDFLKDNSSRLIRAVDRDPGMEVPVVANGIQKGISRELVDSLKTQLEDREQALRKVESDTLTLERRLGQEQADHRRAKETATVELGRIKTVNQNLQNIHEEEIKGLQADHQATLVRLQAQNDVVAEDLRNQIARVRREADESISKIREADDADITELKDSVRRMEAELDKAGKDHMQDLETAHEEYSLKLEASEARAKRAEERAEEAEGRARRASEDSRAVEERVAYLTQALEESERAGKNTQTGLDDLLMVLSDLEEKRSKDKKRLKALGEVTSDDGDDDTDEDGSEVGGDVNGTAVRSDDGDEDLD